MHRNKKAINSDRKWRDHAVTPADSYINRHTQRDRESETERTTVTENSCVEHRRLELHDLRG